MRERSFALSSKAQAPQSKRPCRNPQRAPEPGRLRPEGWLQMRARPRRNLGTSPKSMGPVSGATASMLRKATTSLEPASDIQVAETGWQAGCSLYAPL
ncbi:hypothetical protein BD310DRAFT_677537 [Dichomitus squalens]|uniref:Uncharacterized protein n=1 Tax=Dichomitus squalens TaxID=114155 RepID=A0A4V2K7C2_9APHY|nr:hypothetical protein BD310DRAFT_677537 [Dichomitus squalens]